MQNEPPRQASRQTKTKIIKRHSSLCWLRFSYFRRRSAFKKLCASKGKILVNCEMNDSKLSYNTNWWDDINRLQCEMCFTLLYSSRSTNQPTTLTFVPFLSKFYYETDESGCWMWCCRIWLIGSTKLFTLKFTQSMKSESHAANTWLIRESGHDFKLNELWMLICSVF